MDNFSFCSPTEFVFGKDTENECGKYVRKYGGSKVLLHYGSGSAVKSGLLDRVKKSLEKENIPYTELGGVKPNPRDTKVYEGMIIGMNSRNEDMVVNPCKAKKATNMRSAGNDDAVKLSSPKVFTLEEALEFINDDELVEVVPDDIRLRKKLLHELERRRSGR